MTKGVKFGKDLDETLFVRNYNLEIFCCLSRGLHS